ncbi:hypothetical protein FRIGORI9N_470164 [Frigoribacterium sp. 9N]|nr:hypothetical protein FRIGORI9N_470164 [Frigoribacterium sp. 9N]
MVLAADRPRRPGRHRPRRRHRLRGRQHRRSRTRADDLEQHADADPDDSDAHPDPDVRDGVLGRLRGADRGRCPRLPRRTRPAGRLGRRRVERSEPRPGRHRRQHRPDGCPREGLVGDDLHLPRGPDPCPALDAHRHPGPDRGRRHRHHQLARLHGVPDRLLADGLLVHDHRRDRHLGSVGRGPRCQRDVPHGDRLGRRQPHGQLRGQLRSDRVRAVAGSHHHGDGPGHVAGPEPLGGHRPSVGPMVTPVVQTTGVTKP